MNVNQKRPRTFAQATLLFCVVSLCFSQASAQTTQSQFGAPTIGPRPINQPSLVDKYRRNDQPQTNTSSPRFQETSAFQPASYSSNNTRTTNPIRQTVAMQNAPSGTSTLPFPGNGAAPQSSSDLSQVTQPQLSTSGFATMNNCNCVSGPSSYTAASGIGCGQNYGYAAPVGYTAPQQQIAAPAQMPALTPMNQTMTGRPLPQSATGAPASSLFTLGQSNYAVQVGQGLWGQPVAYVPGQRVRNWIRYMSP